MDYCGIRQSYCCIYVTILVAQLLVGCYCMECIIGSICDRLVHLPGHSRNMSGHLFQLQLLSGSQEINIDNKDLYGI